MNWWVVVLMYDECEPETYIDIVQAKNEPEAEVLVLENFFDHNISLFEDSTDSRAEQASRYFNLNHTQFLCLNDFFVNLEYKQ